MNCLGFQHNIVWAQYNIRVQSTKIRYKDPFPLYRSGNFKCLLSGSISFDTLVAYSIHSLQSTPPFYSHAFTAFKFQRERRKMTKKFEDDVAVARERVEKAESDLATAKTALGAAKTVVGGDRAVEAYRQKERSRKIVSKARKNYRLTLVRGYLKELAAGYKKTGDLIEAHAGRAFLPYRIRRFERKVEKLLNNLRAELAHVNIPFAWINPGKIPSAVYFSRSSHVRIQGYYDKSNYWTQVLEDKAYPWALF